MEAVRIGAVNNEHQSQQPDRDRIVRRMWAACCQVVTRPPFYNVFKDIGEDAWERLKADRPDIVAELAAGDRARRANGGPSFGTPCVWFEAATGRCGHYEYRPLACREFEVGGEDCRDARRRADIV